MSKTTPSSLTMSHILTLCLCFIAIPFCTMGLNQIVQQKDISQMFVLTTTAIIMMIRSKKILSIHAQRLQQNPSDYILFCVVGIIALMIWIKGIGSLIHFPLPLPSSLSLIRFGYARFAMWIAFSFFQSIIFHLTFKAITDRFEVVQKEIQAIGISAVLCGFLFSIVLVPFGLALLPGFLFYLIYFALMSYLYNQTHQLYTGITVTTICFFFSMLI